MAGLKQGETAFDGRLRSGLGAVGQYQMSAVPFASSSIIVEKNGSNKTFKVQFPYITRFVTVQNTTGSGGLRVGFSDYGTQGASNRGADPGFDAAGNEISVHTANYFFVLADGESYTGEWRLQELYLQGDGTTQCSASVIAGLTMIRQLIPSLSGSVVGIDAQANDVLPISPPAGNRGSPGGQNWSGSVGVG
jgi:hypothetical protein|tara:strand:- start:1398 stop:1973 length:576 start_codon:yes stop_codon:yes gene_type:complete